MTTAPLSTTTSAAAAASTVNSGLATMANNYQTFLSLLTAQLRNQDPLSPMDSTQFTSQLTAMTGVQQQLLTNQLLQQIANNGSASNAIENAANMIGKTVTVDASSATLASGTANWSFSLPSAPSSLVMSVVDSNNNVVWTGPVTGSGAGAQSFTWNGQNMAGQQLDDGGTYSLTIKATDAAGKSITPVTTYKGSVTAVDQVGGQTMVTVNGVQTPLSSIVGVLRLAKPGSREEGLRIMSLYSAMLAGVTGLQSNSTALASISQNIANVNTTGYKANNTSFETLVTTNTGQGAYSAGGVSTTNTQFVTAQGSMTQTQSPTDLAISGQGMFVTATQPASPTAASNQVMFTRAGSFTTDAAGNLKNAAGLYLLGWPANSNGTVTTSNIMSSLQPINVNALSSAVSPTTTASIPGNLNAEQTVSAPATAAAALPVGAGAYDALTNSMSAYNASAGTGVQPDFTIQIPVSDSLGGQHTLQLDMLKSATANQWYAEIQAVPASDVVSGAGLAPGQLAAGIVAFNPDGSINMTNTTLFGTPTPSQPSLTIGASSAAAPTGTQVNWAAGLGVLGQTINVAIDPTSGSPGLTQFAGSNSAGNVITNGTTFGSLTSVSVAQDGMVNATFSNGTTRPIAQIALATFPNEDGMTAVNGDAFQASAASGTYNLTTAGNNGAGKVASNTLEASTVDLSTQFTALITTQSAYSAASKVITTADNMT